MSVINQMLRDLDARGAAPRDFPAAQGRATVSKHDSAARLAMWVFLLLVAGAVVDFFAPSGTASKRGNSAPVGMAPQGAHSARVADVPTSHGDPQPVPEAPTTRRFVASSPAMGGADGPTLPGPASDKPVSVHAVPKLPPVQMIQVARPMDESQPRVDAKPVILPASAASAATQAEPAVVKKMSQQLPEVEAQQDFDDAQALRRSGNVDAAIGKYRQALERNPEMRNARIQLASVLRENGQPDAALALLKTGYERQPDDGLAIAVGRLLANQGRRDESLSWLERASGGLRPADYALMGALLSQAQRYEDAVKAYQRALAIDPHQGGWLLGLGLALESLGRADEAQTAYRNALGQGEFKPDVVSFLRQKIRTPIP